MILVLILIVLVTIWKIICVFLGDIRNIDVEDDAESDNLRTSEKG